MGNPAEVRPRLTILQREIHGILVLDLFGDLVMDRETRRLREDVEGRFAAGLPQILLNFSRVRHVDSMGAGVLVIINNVARASNASLKLCELSPTLRQVLERLQLHKVLEIFETEAEALAAARGSQAAADQTS